MTAILCVRVTGFSGVTGSTEDIDIVFDSTSSYSESASGSVRVDTTLGTLAVNNAIKNAAKDLHNQQYSRDFGLLDTYMVFGRSL